MTAELGHLLPSRAVPNDGSFSPDSCRARRMLLTAELGQQRTPAVHTVTDESAGAISAADLKRSDRRLRTPADAPEERQGPLNDAADVFAPRRMPPDHP